MKSEKKLPSALPLYAIFTLSPFLIGVYYEWLSCAVSLALAGYLLYCGLKTGGIAVPKSPLAAACGAIVLFFAISPLWAVDRGMAILGAVKFLPLPLFCIALAQVDSDCKEDLLKTVPLCGAAMTAVSYGLSFVRSLSKYFLVSGRLSGFFQYSNTFAGYLLSGLIIAVLGYKKPGVQIPLSAVLLFGILMSGSRTVFILLAIFIVIFIIFLKNKKLRLSLLAIFIGLTALAAVGAAITGNLGAAGRFLTSSLNSSTFVGRMLYYKDALPVILRRPLGLGYMGYYFLQSSFKTGVYTVVNIHNDFLQLLLDIGWLPFAICVFVAIKSFKKVSAANRAVIAAILLHCLLDFDLQFLAVCFVLIAAMCHDGCRSFALRSKAGMTLIFAAIAAFSVYFGIASGLYYFNRYSEAAKVYPAYTSAYVEMISEAESLEEMDSLADEIFRFNKSVSIAHSIKGRAAFARGNVEKMIEYMRQAVALSRYRIDEYRDYRDMLRLAISAYERSGDEKSADYCRAYLDEVYATLDRVAEETSPLAWKIDVKPILEMD